METYRGKAYKMIMQKGYEPSVDTSKNQITFKQMDILAKEQRENIINETFEALRDASSMETARAIQDSEGLVAQDQKKMIKILADKGWSKNEVIYEMQRLFGNDVLIHVRLLDDERSWLSKNKLFLGFGLLIGSAMGISRYRAMRAARLLQMSKNPVQQHQSLHSQFSKLDLAEKEEIFKKLNIKK